VDVADYPGSWPPGRGSRRDDGAEYRDLGTDYFTRYDNPEARKRRPIRDLHIPRLRGHHRTRRLIPDSRPRRCSHLNPNPSGPRADSACRSPSSFVSVLSATDSCPVGTGLNQRQARQRASRFRSPARSPARSVWERVTSVAPTSKDRWNFGGNGYAVVTCETPLIRRRCRPPSASLCQEYSGFLPLYASQEAVSSTCPTGHIRVRGAVEDCTGFGRAS
jgi:hypothetical protein